METHVHGDKVIDNNDVESLERTVNGHAIMFSRILRIGESWGHEQRVKAAMTTVNGTIPKMFGLRKDHKEVPPDRKDIGPPTRPVCGASSSINGPMLHLMSEILNKLADNMDKEINSECRNTEEMIASLEQANQSAASRDFQVWSSDVKALYPSLKVEEVIKVIGQEYLNSNLGIDVNVEELSLYLAIVMKKADIEREGFEEIICTWVNEGGSGRRPGITTAEVMGGDKARKNSKFLKPSRKPTKEEERKMMSHAIKSGIEVVMRNHIYTFNGKTYQRAEGGPIGLE